MQEPVALRLGQRVDALLLDRVLRGHDQERLAAPGGSAPPIDTCCSAMTSSSADCTLAGRAVDLVGEQEVDEHRAELDVELLAGLPVDPGADDVGGHQVGGELDAGERAADDPGQRLHGEGLGHAGHALEQAVAAGQQRDEHPLDHPVLADDDPLDLEQGPLQHGRVLGGCRDLPAWRRDGVARLGHRSSTHAGNQRVLQASHAGPTERDPTSLGSFWESCVATDFYRFFG